MSYRAVIFDLGGVVLESPLHEIARFEDDQGLPDGFINHVVVSTGSKGAWACLERGELPLETFYTAFRQDCEAHGFPVDGRALMERIGRAARPRAAMLAAIAALRTHGFQVAALTNNWVGEDGAAAGATLRPLFDLVVESSVVGLHKPDPRIYHLACERLGITPTEAVFLDDIGRNLKTARELGMRTIRVNDPDEALDELGALLGIQLRGLGDAT
jgi:putative hydrolase of the HAD superfamily